ncbi:Pancreatic lipase-related protein 2 [Pseudolycoriella hygida]|uniref:Pancreatic lipase-related protein 2 n=1 Tax=Pseudolycoriella hygida TaxID=35572 RepID=A0A9Q0RXS7_9DIPT|nr:Pancreatic lipase-related protein 2 [Pseudolycoriella hygida]
MYPAEFFSFITYILLAKSFLLVSGGNTYGSSIKFYNGATINTHTSHDLTTAENVADDAGFNLTRTTMIFVHGYNESPDTATSATLINAYLTNGQYNILAFDWRNGAAGTLIDVANRIDGSVILLVLIWLEKSENILLGGLDKRNLLTGLDPAIIYTDPDILNYNHARFVDIIHTDIGGLGIIQNTGTVDFFPNGGVARQPGCPIFPITVGQIACSHMRSIYYWAESVARGNQTTFLSVNRANPNIIIQMGNNCPTSYVQGYYDLTTNHSPPFSMT